MKTAAILPSSAGWARLPPACFALEPPEQPSLYLAGCALSLAALVSATRAASNALPPARKAALVSSLGPQQARALTSVLDKPDVHEARWRTVQAASFAAAFVWASGALSDDLLTAAAIVGIYSLLAIPSSALAHQVPTRLAPPLLTVLRPIGLIVAPVTDPLSWAAAWVAKRVPSFDPSEDRGEHQSISSDLATRELEHAVSHVEDAGALEREASQMMRNVLSFRTTEAASLLVPRPQIVAVDIDAPFAETLALIDDNEHSRYPVYRDSLDNVVGVLHVKDLFLHRKRSPLVEPKVEDLVRPPVFVPESQSAPSVLAQLRAGSHHMALVLDEYGGLRGLLTLEDLLEEIVGEIRDEYDEGDEAPIIDLGNGRLVVDASVPITELSRQAGIELPEDGEYHSLGGFIVEVMGRVPEPGAVIERLGHRFLIRTADERHVTKVEIVPAAR